MFIILNSIFKKFLLFLSPLSFLLFNHHPFSSLLFTVSFLKIDMEAYLMKCHNHCSLHPVCYYELGAKNRGLQMKLLNCHYPKFGRNSNCSMKQEPACMCICRAVDFCIINYYKFYLWVKYDNPCRPSRIFHRTPVNSGYISLWK